MTKYYWLLLPLSFSLIACVGNKAVPNKIFSNAQVQYEAKEAHKIKNRREMEMPSYFLEIEYQPSQSNLNAVQISKISSLFQKLIYPDEYKLYVSFGASDENHDMADTGLLVKRANDIKKRYAGKVKSIQIAYLKNQKPNSVYLRLLNCQ